MRQVINYNNKNWELPTPIVPTDYRFRLEAIENSQISLTKKSSRWSNFQYSTDNGSSWTEFTTSSNITLNAGAKAYFRAKQTSSSTQSNYTQFSITGKVKCAGNIMYLYNYENPDTTSISYSFAFYNLFNSCAIYDASELLLPATSISSSCYRNLFDTATMLTYGPAELPATSVPSLAYGGMFGNATGLTNAPIIRATSISTQGCIYMFYNCSLITRIEIYASSGVSTSNLEKWTAGFGETGDFYNLGGATYSTGQNGIPSGWTEHTSL